jgi:metallo-beta-lactamase class B
MRIFFIAGLIFTIAKSGQSQENRLVITPLKGDFYIYTTYHDYGGKPFPSNSMYLVTDKGIILFDTPWDSTQFQPLMDSVLARHGKKITLCIATHFHADRTAGLEFYAKKGVMTYTSRLTDDFCVKRNEKRAVNHFSDDTSFVWGQYSFETYYPGHGHSKDNIVIWFEKDRILYGGCFVKSVENDNMGNIADANITEWKNAVKKVIRKYPSSAYIIPGHFGCGSKEALKHTLKLIEKHEEENK